MSSKNYLSDSTASNQVEMPVGKNTVIKNSEVTSSYYGSYESEDVSEEEKECRSYVAVWRSVILQAVIDSKSKSKRKDVKKAKQDILANLENKKYRKNFHIMCKEAKISSNLIINHITH